MRKTHVLALPPWAANRAKWVLALSILLVMYIFGATYLPSLIFQNLGWLYFAQSSLDPQPELFTHTQTNFARSLAGNPRNVSSWRGQALVAALGEQRNLAFESWSNARMSTEQILKYGQMQQSAGKIAASLITFQSAIPFEPVVPNSATYAALNICRSVFADIDTYSPDFVLHCGNELDRNDNNLLSNPQFFDGASGGWNGEFFFARPHKSELTITQAEGHPSPSAAIIGKVAEPHRGLYQTVCLSPGTTVRFSGWFRVESSGAIEARLLYVGWRQNNQPAGNQGQLVTDELNWTYLEREFTLPRDALPHVQFYPANIAGTGTVWFDDLRLQIVEQPRPQPNRSAICR